MLAAEVDLGSRGIGLVALRAIEAGTVVLEEEAAGFALCPELRSRVCRMCCTVSDECFPHCVVCVGCDSAHYCSVACLAADADSHVLECGMLWQYGRLREEWTEMGEDDETFLLCLLSLLVRGENLAGLASIDAPDESLPVLHAVAACVLEAAGMGRLLPSLPKWTLLCQREQINSFGLFDTAAEAALHCFGRGVFVAASRFNHSCAPNVSRLRDGRRIVFVANRVVEAGEELTIAYVSLGMGRAQRRAALLADYRFVCECDRCMDDKVVLVCEACEGEMLFGSCVHHDRAFLIQQLRGCEIYCEEQ